MSDFPPNNLSENTRRHVSPGQDLKGQSDVEVSNLSSLSGMTEVKATDDFHLMPPRPPHVADFSPHTGPGKARRRMSLGQVPTPPPNHRSGGKPVPKMQSDIVVPSLYSLGGETTLKSTNEFQTYGRSSLPNEDLDFDW
eukprot:CAMPEP_0119051114 /NCGR_PEP_ID=MMETSP1177-20130426/72842_1 /TAXON_ID=2985 /ORGANISM="Ochromonas sp, Strain CCMP1899" /LENGTH=138 /DNA_ID=CAMNT_0007030215 /DNA_START=125 /DNA_END=538 /DNA_ORIENTATION=+